MTSDEHDNQATSADRETTELYPFSSGYPRDTGTARGPFPDWQAADQPLPELPDVRPVRDTLPSFDIEGSWEGWLAPAKTPPEIVRKMNAGVVKALADPAIVDKLAHTAYAVESSSPNELRNFLKTDTEKWQAVIKATGLKID